MIEVQLVNSQSADTTDTALTASSDVLSAAGFSVDDLFSPGSNYESTLNMLQENGVDTEEAMAMVAFAQGLASKNDAAMDAFSTALQRYQTQVNSQSSRYKEIKATYETDEKVQAGADTLRDLLKQLYGGNFTGEDVLGGVSMSTSFFPSGKESSKKKWAFRTALLLSLFIAACGSEAPQTQTETIIFNGEYVLQAERSPIGAPMSGLLSDKDGNLIDINGNNITPVQVGDKYRYDGVYAIDKFKFQFSSAKAVSNKDSNKTGEVITLRQVDKNNVTGAELYLALSDSPDVYKLIDQYNNSDLYTLTVKGNKIILTDVESQQHYLITDATFVNDMATPGATDSPELLIQNIKEMFALYTVVEAKGFDATPTVLASVTPVTPATSMPTETPAPIDTPNPLDNAPEGTTGFNENGDPIREVKYENGKTFVFQLNEQGKWVRPVVKFPLLDLGPWNYIPFDIMMSEDAKGGEHVLEITHVDSTDDNNRPITTKIRNLFLTRLGLSPSDPEYYRLVNEEMDKGSESDARFPIITSDGDDTEIILSNVNGISMTIDSADNLKKLFEEGRAIQWFDGHGGTYYLRVTAVNNNAVCTIASERPLEELSDTAMRNFIFSCVSHIFTQVDQREYLNYSNTQFLANGSSELIKGMSVPEIEIIYP